MKNGRPTFYFNADPNKPVRAGGILFYTIPENSTTNEPLFLMTRYWDVWSDFGGKSDAVDECIEDMVAREVSEETNCMFVSETKITDKETMFQHLNQSCNFLKEHLKKDINKNSKFYFGRYVMWLVYLEPDTITKKACDLFGEIELSNDYPRIVQWVTINEMKEIYKNKKMHYRLNPSNEFKFNTILKHLYNKHHIGESV
jgi:hypothetical protein